MGWLASSRGGAGAAAAGVAAAALVGIARPLDRRMSMPVEVLAAAGGCAAGAAMAGAPPLLVSAATLSGGAVALAGGAASCPSEGAVRIAVGFGGLVVVAGGFALAVLAGLGRIAEGAGWAAVATAFLGLFAAYELALSRLLRRELDEETALGILPKEHADALSSPWRRRLSGWWPDGAERRIYVRTVLRLVRRKGATRRLAPDRARISQVEVLRLRERIRAMLAPVEPELEDTLSGEKR